MRIKEFEYHSPVSLPEACRLLKAGGPGARILAGGTDVLPDLKRGRITASSLISLARLGGLRKIEGGARRRASKGSALRIGPLVTPNMLAGSGLVRRSFPGLSEAAASMAANQIRNMATLGGNLCSAVPSADLPPSLLTVEAELVLTSHAGQGGAKRHNSIKTRRIALKDFFLGPRRTAIRRTEILTAVLIPELPAGTGTAYEKFQARDASALAIAGVAARLTVKNNKVVKALVAIGACAPTPLLIDSAGEFLEGKAPSEQNFARAGELAAQLVKPITDIRGSERYRREICRVLTIRVLNRALKRTV